MLNTTIFQQNLETICEDYKKSKFLLAVSGGVDSMILLDLFSSLNLSFEVAHINYNLRGSDSKKDAQLVEKICVKNKIPFHLYEVSAIDNQPKNSIQEWARNLRYDFFRKIKKEGDLDIIVTAHHLNDQLETFIINLSKASGIKGLTGIPANENGIIRPLLQFSKKEIYNFSKEKKVEFQEDLSNQKNDYLRNKIRKEIVPKFDDVNSDFLENFGKSLLYLNEVKDFATEKIGEIETEIINENKGLIIIDKEKLFRQLPFAQFEILRKFGFESKEEFDKIEKAEKGKVFISKNYELTVDRKILSLEKIVIKGVEILDEDIILHLNNDNEILFPLEYESGSLKWKIDAQKIQLPLKLRRRKEGDIFHPIGMIGKKKIAKFFKDEKIPIFAQQKIWILSDENDAVLGIIPFRQDRRFVATKESKDLITVKL